jgi:P27 family predicted phage terminase small subunit
MPAPKSPKLRALGGEKRPSRLRKSAAASVRPAPPAPPADLTGTALAIWLELAPEIWRAGHLLETDRTAFSVLCGILATERLARRALELDGLTTKSEAGTLKAHPALRAIETARQQARGYLDAFAMTPVGRQRMDPAPDPTRPNEFEEFEKEFR